MGEVSAPSSSRKEPCHAWGHQLPWALQMSLEESLKQLTRASQLSFSHNNVNTLIALEEWQKK